MKLKSKMTQATAGVLAIMHAKIKRRASVFDLRDLTLLVAATVSFTFVISFFIFSIYYYFNKDPFILMLSITMLSILFSCALFLLFRIDFSRGAPIEDEDKLVQNLHGVARIRKEKSLGNPTSDPASTMSTRYPTGLVRVFTIGVCIAAVGLLAIVIGAVADNAEVQFGGSTALAIGCVALTLAVFQGENLDRRSL